MSVARDPLSAKKFDVYVQRPIDVERSLVAGYQREPVLDRCGTDERVVAGPAGNTRLDKPFE